jgi:two-component system, OmpR family, KDP operon response regulator KdpE
VTEPVATVLLVEDEPEMRRFLRAALTSRGYKLHEAVTLAEATLLATSHQPDLVLLDLGLPDGEGLGFLQKLREWSQAPVIVLSARGREDDKVDALDAGADDYLTKPFGTGELLARIRVALRHRDATKGPELPAVLRFGQLELDLGKRLVRRGEEEIHLTPIEYKLLVLLARHAGRVITHRQILKEIWGPNVATQTHYVRVHMAELRKKIEREPARPTLVTTEPGVGYRLREPDAP